MKYFKNLKNLFCCFLIVVFTFVLYSAVFADVPEKPYNVNYKECNIYRSPVVYEKDYIISFNEPVLKEGNFNTKNVKFLYKFDGDKLKKVYENKIPNYFIEMKNNNLVKTVTGDLKLGENKIELIQEFNNRLLYKFEVTITVKEKASKRIDKKTFSWKQVDKPIINFVNDLKYGKVLKKKSIEIGTEKYKTNEDIFSIGKTFFYFNKKPSNIYFTKNKKLVPGDNSLETKLISYPNKEKIRYWFKVEYIVNLEEIVPDEPTPTTDNTKPTVNPTPNIDNNNNNNDIDVLPKTGENGPLCFYLIGFVVISAGISTIIFRKKIFYKKV